MRGRPGRRSGTGAHAARADRRSRAAGAATRAPPPLDLDAGVVRVVGALAELDGGQLLEDTPKSRAGRRVVSIPPEIIPDLQAHLDEFAEDGPNG